MSCKMVEVREYGFVCLGEKRQTGKEHTASFEVGGECSLRDYTHNSERG